MRTWGAKTLEDLRRQAKAQANGMVFEAIRGSAGCRLVIVVCVTKRELVKKLMAALSCADNGGSEDWSKAKVIEVALRAAVGSGLAFRALRDASGQISDLALVSAEPKSIAIIERFFRLPR